MKKFFDYVINIGNYYLPVAQARNLMARSRYDQALIKWVNLINQSPEKFFQVCKQDTNILEDIITSIYSNLVKSGDICVDGGAHLGVHTLPLARLTGEKGKVYAFEPLPDFAKKLQQKILYENLQNVIIIENALSNKKKTVNFHFVKNAPAYSGIEKRQNYDKKKPNFIELSVNTITLDEVLENQSSWRFCKLDLEGGEFNCLQGAVKSIQKFSPFIIFENARQSSAISYNYTMEDWFTLFENIDYQVFDLFGQKFRREKWSSPFVPWYFMAVKTGSTDHEFIKHNFLLSTGQNEEGGCKLIQR